MTDLPTIVGPGSVVVPDELSSDELLRLGLSKLGAKTRLCYAGDWARFAAWMDAQGVSLRTFLELPMGRACQMVNGYVDFLTSQGKAPATRARALQAIRKMTRIWFVAGVSRWELPRELLQSVRVQRYKDVSGIPAEDFRRILEAARLAEWHPDALFHNRRPISLVEPPQWLLHGSLRDYPILLLLHDSALRRREVATMALRDFDPKRRVVWVWGKRMAEGDRRYVPMTRRTQDAIEAWLDIRGRTEGPLFTRLPISRHGLEGLDGDAIEYVTKVWSRRAGLDPVAPHQLRHTAITRAAERGVAAQDLMDYARHADFSTTKVYIHTATSNVRDVAELVALEEDEDHD